RRQVGPSRRRDGSAAHWTASLAYGFGPHSRGRFSVYQRIAAATPDHSACSVNPLVYSSIFLAGVGDFVDDPCAVYRLVQRLDAQLSRESRCMISTQRMPEIVIVEKSRPRPLTHKKANGRRKLVTSPAYSSYRLRAVDRGPIELGRTIATLAIWSK